MIKPLLHFYLGGRKASHSREVEHLAKETMRVVNEAEQKASDTIQQAKEESERLRREAADKGQQLIAEAVKEARKRAGIR